MSRSGIVRARLHGTIAFGLIVVYLVCLEAVVPRLSSRGLPQLWWLLLLSIVVGSWAWWRFWVPSRDAGTSSSLRIRWGDATWVLLGLTLFAYDPTIQPALAGRGLGRLWIVLLSLTFLSIGVRVWLLFHRSGRRSVDGNVPARDPREILDDYRRGRLGWTEFEREFQDAYIDRESPEGLSEEEEDFLADVQDRIDWTSVSPIEEDRNYGWIAPEEFRRWLEERIASRDRTEGEP